MTEYANAAGRLRELIQFLEENSIPVPETEFTSNLGEWLVMDQLVSCGHSPTLQSGQYDVDILLQNGERVEVKSGTWDSTFGGVYRFDRIKPGKLDYLVCVKFEAGYSDVEYFVFSSEEVDSLPPRNRSAFSDPDREDDQRLLRILDDPKKTNRRDMQEINWRLNEFCNAWQKIASAEQTLCVLPCFLWLQPVYQVSQHPVYYDKSDRVASAAR